MTCKSKTTSSVKLGQVLSSSRSYHAVSDASSTECLPFTQWGLLILAWYPQPVPSSAAPIYSVSGPPFKQKSMATAYYLKSPTRGDQSDAENNTGGLLEVPPLYCCVPGDLRQSKATLAPYVRTRELHIVLPCEFNPKTRRKMCPQVNLFQQQFWKMQNS